MNSFITIIAVIAANMPAATVSYIRPPDPTYQQIAQSDSEKYGADFARLWATVNCEDPALDTDQQSDVKDPKGPRGRENSWGLTQIDLDYNPDISKADAEDPSFALDLMARNFAQGRASLYHCYSDLYGGPKS